MEKQLFERKAIKIHNLHYGPIPSQNSVMKTMSQSSDEHVNIFACFIDHKT